MHSLHNPTTPGHVHVRNTVQTLDKKNLSLPPPPIKVPQHQLQQFYLVQPPLDTDQGEAVDKTL